MHCWFTGSSKPAIINYVPLAQTSMIPCCLVAVVPLYILMELPCCGIFSAHEFDARRRMISKNFHHVMRVSDRQPLVGPPESMREHVVAASKAMKNGDWTACSTFIINDKMNSKVNKKDFSETDTFLCVLSQMSLWTW